MIFQVVQLYQYINAGGGSHALLAHAANLDPLIEI
jgi:hypothetical protein